MALSDIFKKKINNPKFKELTGAETFGDFTLMTLGKKPLGGQAAENIKKIKDKNTNKKNETSVKKVDKKMLQAKRKGRGYSILNTAMGLDDSIKTKKKTLLG
jgi:hypothetical protein